LPVERIEKHLSDIKQGTVDPCEKVRDVSTCHVFLRASSGFKTLSDEVILKALVRSGNLTLGLTRENGFVLGSAYGFFRDLLLSMNESPRNKNAERIFEVLNNVQDIQMVATIKARILESFMEFDARRASGALFLECMARFLDDSRYGELRQNMTLNLRLLNVRQLEVLQAHGSEVFYGNPLIQQLGNSAGSILQSLLSELKALNPLDFRLPHFCAISTLVDNSTMLDEPIYNLWPELLFVALRALDAYRETPHHKDYTIIQGANHALESLIRHVAMAKNIDYKSFATLASGSKVLLASNGFDIKKLPGMTPRHRGQVLSDQLGL
jgi:hypothetical protein